jgi:hypothetical protein
MEPRSPLPSFYTPRPVHACAADQQGDGRSNSHNLYLEEGGGVRRRVLLVLAKKPIEPSVYSGLVAKLREGAELELNFY